MQPTRLSAVLAVLLTGSVGLAHADGVNISASLSSACAVEFDAGARAIATFCNVASGYDLTVHHMTVPAGTVAISWQGRTFFANPDGHTQLGGSPGPDRRTDVLSVDWPGAGDAERAAFLNSLVVEIAER
jgi:hypothetical protein